MTITYFNHLDQLIDALDRKVARLMLLMLKEGLL